MRRLLGLGALVAGALLSVGPASGAEVTRVASSGDPGNPFDLDLQVRYERGQRKARITREFGDATSNPPAGSVRDESELWYEQTTNRAVGRLAVGLWHDLELRAELPYVLGDKAGYTFVGGSERSIDLNALLPDGSPCPGGACPIFPVGQTVYHGGVFGDLTFGLAWGILSERGQDWAPAWVLAFDVTAPTAGRYDPAQGRGADFRSPYGSTSRQAPVGRKVWIYQLSTAISKRAGAAEPYVRAQVRFAQRSSQTYSNCARAAELAAAGQATPFAAANCALPQWRDEAGANPPTVAGLEAGVELVPYEDRADHQRFAIDLRLGGEYVSQARWYNELTDVTGKLMWTDPYLTFKALLGLSLRASSYVHLRAAASLSHDFSHFISGEPLGRGAGDVLAAGDLGGPRQNPNFDWRYDAPGRRFRVSETAVFDLTLAATINF